MPNIIGIVRTSASWWRKMRSKKYGVIALALFACFALLFCTGGESAAFPGEPAGFSGLTWGTPIDVLESLKYVGTDSAGMSLYERAGDELFLAGRGLPLSSTVLRMGVLRPYPSR